MHKYVDCLKQDKGLAWPNIPSLKEEHYQEISSFRSPRKIIIVMEKIKGAFLNLYPMNICTFFVFVKCAEWKKLFRIMWTTETRPEIRVILCFQDLLRWSVWLGPRICLLMWMFQGRDYMMSLLYVKYKSHNQYFHYSYERCIYTKDWVPVRLHN